MIADPAAYGEWVVGTRAIVRADAGWPEVGSAIDYEIGIGRLAVGDHTRVVEADPPRRLLLRAELSRLGAAEIVLRLEPHDGGTRVVMEEHPVGGAAARLHSRLSDFVLARRNDEALRRLRRLAEEA